MSFKEPKLSDNFKYSIEIEYSSEYNCERNGCDSICRCGRIVDQKILSGPSTWLKLYEHYWQPKNKDNYSIDDVLAYHLVRHTFNINDYNISVCGGYYGEEIDSVNLSNNDVYRKQVMFDSLKTTKDKMECVLSFEYGYILPELKNINDWELKKVPRDSIQFGKCKPDPLLINEYKTQLNQKTYIPRGEKTNNTFYNALKLYSPICLEKTPGKYEIIDGHHKFFAIEKNYKLTKWETKPTKSTKKNQYISDCKSVEENVSIDDIWIIIPKKSNDSEIEKVETQDTGFFNVEITKSLKVDFVKYKLCFDALNETIDKIERDLPAKERKKFNVGKLKELRELFLYEDHKK